jgi:hypothetical protein
MTQPPPNAGEEPRRGKLRPLGVQECPAQVAELQQRCVAYEARLRPRASEIVEVLRGFTPRRTRAIADRGSGTSPSTAESHGTMPIGSGGASSSSRGGCTGSIGASGSNDGSRGTCSTAAVVQPQHVLRSVRCAAPCGMPSPILLGAPDRQDPDARVGLAPPCPNT